MEIKKIKGQNETTESFEGKIISVYINASNELVIEYYMDEKGIVRIYFTSQEYHDLLKEGAEFCAKMIDAFMWLQNKKTE